uniref:Malic enzyme n=1 Tax=Heterosiphonia pulchra TaxID=189631 RepID=A0A097IUI9_9FLOR|nr:malic enzyme [Heterosiphonia pulchra]
MPPHPILSDPRNNRGRRFPIAQRDHLQLHGLVHPASPLSLHHQVAFAISRLRSLPTPLAKYEYLLRLVNSDEQLFFSVAQSHLSAVLPFIYTPTVGDACLNFPTLDIPLRGVWLSLPLSGAIASVLRNAARKNNPDSPIDVIVVSDCQRILGLGDLGANGMPIPVGKLLLYSACGGVDPATCLPVVLDVGCNTQSVREDPQYTGIRSTRVVGPKYDNFIDEFITAAKEVFGPSCLIQFEDFANANAARLLEKYRKSVCCFNDDIQGTAAVAVAGIMAAIRVPGVDPDLRNHKFLFIGAGSAGIGIADLMVMALTRLDIPEEQARRQCWFIDSKGLIVQGRGSLSEAKTRYAHPCPPGLLPSSSSDLNDVVAALRPTALIGVSTIPGIFSQHVIQRMAAINHRPIIFALSNPTSKSECSASDAYKFSEGRAVFAAGSPFPPVQLPGMLKTLVPAQGNNSYIFPGVGLGVILSKARYIPDTMLLAAADMLASLVDNSKLSVGCVYPDLDGLLDISAHIAHAVCQHALQLGINGRDVSSLDVDAIRGLMYKPGRDELSV